MTAIEDIEFALWKPLMQALRVGNGNERIEPTDRDLAGHRNFGKPLCEARERPWVIADELYGLEKSRTCVGRDVVLQSIAGQFVFLHVVCRAADELLSRQVFVRLERRGIDQFVQDASYIGMVRGSAADDEAPEDTGMICRCEENRRCADVRCDHVRPVKIKGLDNAKDELSHSFRRPDIGAPLELAKCGQ